MKSYPITAFAILALFAGPLAAKAGEVITDDLTVRNQANMYGSMTCTNYSNPTNGLSLWYRFAADTGATTPDSGPNNYTGTVYGATWTTAGKVDGAYDFDGTTNDRVVVADHNFLSTNYTIAGWMKFDSTAPANILLGQVESGKGYFYFGYEGPGGGKLRLRDHNGSVNVYDINPSWSPSTATWYHIACTRTGSTFYLYVNGAVFSGPTTDADPTTDRSTSWDIGAMTSATNYYTDGLIDEVYIYSRALTSNEVKQLYYAGSTNAGITVGMDADFHKGIRKCMPLGDVTMGVYTNQ